ncbi:MAG: endonuclease V [Nitrososphaerales archaeon]
MSLTVDDAVELQTKLAKKVIRHDVINYNKIQYICGVDVSYRNNRAFASAVVINRESLDAVSSASSIIKVEQPYLPGLLFLRESEPTLSVLKKLEHNYDVLMVDGHGVLHPRWFGLACYVGMKVNKPTIGVAKNLLCGDISSNDSIVLNGRIAGYAVKRGVKPIYVSVGHKISLKTAMKLVKEVSRYRIPEPLRIADINSRRMGRGY